MCEITGHILSSCFVSYVLKSEHIDTIMHFAAQSHVGGSQGRE